MKISLSWLNDFIDIKDFDIKQISKDLTSCGLESLPIESYNAIKNCKELLIGEIVDCWQHPNADKLHCTLVDIGKEEKLNIVCGAPNVRKGIKVVIAPINSTLYPFSGDPFKIKKAKLRGEVSEGMLCAEDEIGLSNNHEQIIELKTDLPNGTPLNKIYKDQQVIEIDITANHADACSHLGVARDLKALNNLFLKFPEIINFKNITENPKHNNLCEECNRYSTAIIKNIKVQESPDWIKERLKALGIRTINNIVDITNYVMMEIGQPLHAFDFSKIIDKDLFVRKSRLGEKLLALNDIEYELTGKELVVADKEKVLSLAGIMGGKESSITDKTTSIVFESAYFNPSIIRKASSSLKLKSEASYRFERGTDPCMTITALQRACFLLKQQQPDISIEEVTDSFTKKPESRKIQFNYAKAKKLIGFDIPNETIADILTRLDIQFENISHEGLTAIVPLYRVDVDREADLVEEILRIYGYDNIPNPDNFKMSILKNQFKSVSDLYNIKTKISNILSYRGFHEIYTNSLTSNENVDDNNVSLINSISSKLNAMRTNMLPSCLEVIDYNFNHDQESINIFEIGKTYHQNKEGKYYEIEHCACAVANKKKKNYNFFDLKNEVYNILKTLEIKDIQETVIDDGIQMSVNNKNICSITTIRHNNYDVFYADIILDNIPELQHSTYREISKYPSVTRDLSLIIDKNTTYQEIKEIINNVNSGYITDYKIIDTYEKDILTNKKTYTISFTLQSMESTLDDKTINNLMLKLISSFKEKINAEILA